MSISRIRGACALLGLFLLPIYVAAEDSGRVIEEILVTAEKREASAQETPIALSAFDQEALDARIHLDAGFLPEQVGHGVAL